MPLTRQVFDTSEEPCNISAMLRQVLGVVKDIDAKVIAVDAKVVALDAKVDAMRAEHESVKRQLADVVGQQVEVVRGKLDDVRTDSQELRTQLRETSRLAAESSRAEQGPPRKRVRFQSASTSQAPDNEQEQNTTEANTQVPPAADPGKVQTSCMRLECARHHSPEINKLVQEYLEHTDWDRLKTGLAVMVDHTSEVNRQLQDSGFLWDIGAMCFTKLASLLLCSGLPVDTADNASGGSTLLHGAAYGGHLLLVRKLLDRGADINARNHSGCTPLMFAARYGQLQVTQRLVQAGADVGARNNNGRTALEQASVRGQPLIVQYLQQFPY